jgi:hypothetical protein
MACLYEDVKVAEIEESMTGNSLKPVLCFCLPLETYHIRLSSITIMSSIMLYIKEIFE